MTIMVAPAIQILGLRFSQDAELRFDTGDWVSARSQSAVQSALDTFLGEGEALAQVWFMDSGSQGTIVVFTFAESGPRALLPVSVREIPSPDVNVSFIQAQVGNELTADDFQIVNTTADPYTLTIDEDPTASINQSDGNNQVSPKIADAIDGITGDVIIYGHPNAGAFMPRHLYVVRFTGNFADTPLPLMEISSGTVDRLLTGGEKQPYDPPLPDYPSLEEEDEYLMIANDYGFHQLNDLIIIPHTTHNQAGPVTPVPDGISLAIYKGTSDVERNTPAGISLSVDHDGVTGNHLIAIDTSDNTDAGFYAENQTFTVLIESTVQSAVYGEPDIVRLRQVRFRLGHQFVDARKLVGTLLSESSVGRLAANFSTLFDNDDAATEQTLETLGGSLDTEAVQTAVNNALVALHLDKLLAAAYDAAEPPGHAAALLNHLIQNSDDGAQFTENALANGPVGTATLAHQLAILAALGDPANASLAADLEQLLQAVQGIVVAVGTGPRAVGVIVKFGEGAEDWLPNAVVRLRRGIESYQGHTDTEGRVQFGVIDDANDWQVVVGKGGYETIVDTLEIDDDIPFGDLVYTIEPLFSHPPTDPAYCVVQCYVQRNQVPDEGAIFRAALLNQNNTIPGVVVEQVVSVLTDENGYAELELIREDQLVKGQRRYNLQVIDSTGKMLVDFNAPIPNQSSVTLEEIIPG